MRPSPRLFVVGFAALLVVSALGGAFAQSREGKRGAAGAKSTQASPPKEAAQPAAPGQGAQGNAVVLYECDNGRRLLASTSTRIALISAGEDNYRLKSAPGPQGTRYAAGPISFATSKNTATFDQHGTVLKCRKAGGQ